MRLVLVAYGVASVVGGAVLFVIPTTVAPRWPWALTPLTGRAVAAWMVALGVAALQAAKENDLRRVRTGLVSFAVIGALGLIAVARFHDQVRWRCGGGWALVAALALTTAVGAYGWWLASRWGDRT